MSKVQEGKDAEAILLLVPESEEREGSSESLDLDSDDSSVSSVHSADETTVVNNVVNHEEGRLNSAWSSARRVLSSDKTRQKNKSEGLLAKYEYGLLNLAALDDDLVSGDPREKRQHNSDFDSSGNASENTVKENWSFNEGFGTEVFPWSMHMNGSSGKAVVRKMVSLREHERSDRYKNDMVGQYDLIFGSDTLDSLSKEGVRSCCSGTQVCSRVDECESCGESISDTGLGDTRVLVHGSEVGPSVGFRTGYLA